MTNLTHYFVFLCVLAFEMMPVRSISQYNNMVGLGTTMSKPGSVGRDSNLYPHINRHLKGSAMNGKEATSHRRRRRAGENTDEQTRSQDYCNQTLPTVGAIRTWPNYDFVLDETYVQDYELRAIAEYIEIWVALDLTFPDPDDCRNILNTTQITDEDVNGFATIFDEIIYPTMSLAFSFPPIRDGTNVSEFITAFSDSYDIPACSYHGDGSRVVTLIQNIRDPDYYSLDSNSFVAGYFSPFLNEYTDRNVMSIDAFDWLHRTGPNPPDASQFDIPPQYNGCEQFALQSVSNGYEAAFVHEYSHLLIYYIGYKESWADEGLAQYATSVVGYSNTFVDPEDSAFEDSLRIFLGFSSYGSGGPEQSLTRWEEQGSGEVLGDYGCAYSFFLYLEGQLGARILKEFRNDLYASGLLGLQNVLDNNGLNVTVQKLMVDWFVALAVAGEISDGALVNGEPSNQSHPFAIPSIPLSKINWTNPECYDKPGVPTNGADFVQLRSEEGIEYLSADDIVSIEFNGTQFYTAVPVEWIETNVSALYSGRGDLLDRSLLRQIDVPSTGVISLDLAWDLELGYDFFFVQIYDEAQDKWVSLESQNTTFESFDLLPRFYPSLPGLTGSSGEEISEQFYQAQEYANKTVYLALRYCTDYFLTNSGVVLYDLTLGDSIVGDATTLSSWQSLTEVFPIPVDSWHVSLVSYTPGGGSVWAQHLPLDGHQFVMNDTEILEGYIGSEGSIVAALVTAFDVSETIYEFATYELYINGILQPGGS